MLLVTKLAKLLLCCAIMSCSVAFAQARPEQATASIETSRPIHPGDEVTFRFKLNDPLPPGARFIARITPVNVSEQLDLGSGEPANAERTEFLVKTKLPAGAYPGEWHIGVIYLFLDGSSWTSGTLKYNDLHFTVAGKPYDVPDNAKVTIENH